MVFHPVQADRPPKQLPEAVTRAAYEVYCEIWGPQPALVEGWCRGGFGLLELIAFLYARSFPRSEWRARFDEALERPAVGGGPKS
jgi:hypothetical protein